MSFAPLQTPFSPLKKTFEEAAQTFTLPSVLPHDIGALKALLVAQQNAHVAVVQAMHQEAQAIRQEAHDYVIRMLEQAVLARQRMFGASSEQLSAQSRLFDEAEALAQTSTAAQDTAPITAEGPLPTADTDTPAPGAKPARGKRAPLAACLLRVDVVHDVPEMERTCACGTPMVEIGQDISEQLDIVPMQVRVLRHIGQALWLPRQPARTRHGSLARAASAQEQRQC